jgi:iron(III) transport system substrate-binding protein
VRQAFGEAFKAYYRLPSSFRVEMLVKNTGSLQKQVEEELAAGRVSVDVLCLNVVAWLAALAGRGQLLAFDAPQYAAYAGWAGRPEFNKRPYFVSDPDFLSSIVWNTEIIKDNAFASWFDLLRPEYKGRITTVSARLSLSYALVYKAMREAPEIGERFFDEFAKLEPVTVTLTTQAIAKVVSGEYPLTVAPASRAYTAWRQGARNLAQSFPKEGVVPLAVPWVVLAGAPHPNAAKLLVNFARTREGQQLMADLDGHWSGRGDVTSPNPQFVPPLDRLKLLHVDELNVSPQEFQRLGQDWKDRFGM